MSTEHPITPPTGLMQQWAAEWHEGSCTQELLEYIATQAARWGADQELEACCEWLADDHTPVLGQRLRADRRPKQPSKKEALDELFLSFDRGYLKKESAETIRRALEQLPDD